MARQRAALHSYQFVKGLATDPSPLAWPDNTCSELENFRLGTDGSLTVRYGLEQETNNDTTKNPTATYSERRGVCHVRWNRAVPNLDVMVIKVGGTLYFRSVTSSGVMTSGSINTSLALSPVSGSTANDVATSTITFAPTPGYLIIAGKHIETQYVVLNPSTYAATATTITIKERDFDGLLSTVGPTERPTGLTFAHNYNLLNAGWNSYKINFYRSERGVYPALSDLINYGYRNSLSTGDEYWDADLCVENSSSTSQSPRGSIILNTYAPTISSGRLLTTYITSVTAAAYTHGAPGSLDITTSSDTTGLLNIGDSIVCNFSVRAKLGSATNPISTIDLSTYGSVVITNVTATTVTVTLTLTGYISNFSLYSAVGSGYIKLPSGNTVVRGAETYRFENTCSWAGRIWYAGIDSSSIGNRIYFSQVCEGPNRFGLCYQEADPTSRHITELVASDGGVIVVNEMGKCLGILPHRNYLVVFTTNGVWIVFGRDGIFDATSYGVRKISEDVIVSNKAFAETDIGIVYWASTSISIITEENGTPISKSMTDGVLKNYVTSYGPTDWPYIRACSMVGARKLAFILPDDDLSASNRVLWFDLLLGAFYEDVHKYDPDEETSIEGIFYQHDVDEDKRFKPLVVGKKTGDANYKVSFNTYTATDYIDFEYTGLAEELDGVVVTGHVTGGDASRPKQGTYLTVSMETIANSSAYMSTIWDFANNTTSNKYSNTQQCYRTVTGRSLSQAKLRVRGWGNSLQIKFETERGKPCKIRGWDIELEANGEV